MQLRPLSFLCHGALALIAAAPALHAASFERFHGDGSHVDTGGWSTVANACPSGGFLTLGNTTTTQRAVHAIRTGADGSILWDRSYTFGPGIVPTASLELRDGSGFVLAGEVVIRANNEADIFLMKLDCAGTPLWTYSYPGVSGFLDAVHVLIETANGDLVGAGSRFDTSATRLDARLLRFDAKGTLLWSRMYDAGDFTNFLGVAEAHGGLGDGDLVVVGYRQDSTDPHRPIVLRLGADGTGGGPRGCAVQYEPATVAIFSAVIELTSPGHEGDFVLAGRIEESGALLLRTAADVCQPVVGRIIEAQVTATTEIAEVMASLPGVPRGTLAVAGTVRVNPQAPHDGYLLTLSPSDLKPLSAHVFGDHSPQATSDSRFAIVRSVLPLSDGFAITGDTTIGSIFEDDMDLYVVKTDSEGQTPCDVAWDPGHRRTQVKIELLELPSSSADLGTVPHTDITVEDEDASRDACE